LPYGVAMVIVPSRWLSAADSRGIGLKLRSFQSPPGGRLRAACGEIKR
jgi:hypothetical protein